MSGNIIVGVDVSWRQKSQWQETKPSIAAVVCLFSFCSTTNLFLFHSSRNAAEVNLSVLDGGDTEEMDAWPVKGKSFISVDPLGQVDWSWAFWFGFYFAFFFPPTESTLLLQLLQTEKVMGLRFCPDKGVRTLSLLLTPLSHQWDHGSRGRGAQRPCQSYLTSQLWFKTLCLWTLTGPSVSAAALIGSVKFTI